MQWNYLHYISSGVGKQMSSNETQIRTHEEWILKVHISEGQKIQFHESLTLRIFPAANVYKKIPFCYYNEQ